MASLEVENSESKDFADESDSIKSNREMSLSINVSYDYQIFGMRT